MRAIVIGGNGFVGSHVCDRLLAAGHDVSIFGRQVRRTDVPTILGDMTCEDQLAAAVRNMDWVFHLAGTTVPQSSNDRPAYDLISNVVSTVHLLDACHRAGVQKIVFCSSGGTIYGLSAAELLGETQANDPICSYGITKLAIEKYLHLFRYLKGLDYTVLRVSNPYGEGQSIQSKQGVIGIWLHQILTGKPLVLWGKGDVVRDFVYVGDVADAFLSVVHHPDTCDRVFNIGTGEGTCLRQLLVMLQEVTGRKVKVDYLSGRRADVPRVVLDISRAREQLGWTPQTSLREGLARTWTWIQQSQLDTGRNGIHGAKPPSAEPAVAAGQGILEFRHGRKGPKKTSTVMRKAERA